MLLRSFFLQMCKLQPPAAQILAVASVFGYFHFFCIFVASNKPKQYESAAAQHLQFHIHTVLYCTVL